MARAKQAAAEKQTASSDVALFFKRPAVLDKVRHAKAGLSPKADLSFAKDTNSVPINAIEFLEAAKHYPIVFTNDETPLPVAVLGWEQGNYFITKQNLWREHSYVPAYVRQYPFIFFQQPESDTYFLCVDEGASVYQENAKKDALPIFTKEGEPSVVAKRALEFCTSFYQHLGITKNLCADLKKHNLLAPYSSKVTINGKEMQLNGFLMIDEKAFNALPEETFLEFRKKGWLAFIYLALASGSNWKLLMELAQAKA